MTLDSLERRRVRLGWSRTRLARESQVVYMRLVRGRVDASDLVRLDQVLTRAEQELVAAIADENGRARR